jgi:hypothetical protein
MIKVMQWEDDPLLSCDYPWFSVMTDDVIACKAYNNLRVTGWIFMKIWYGHYVIGGYSKLILLISSIC